MDPADDGAGPAVDLEHPLADDGDGHGGKVQAPR